MNNNNKILGYVVMGLFLTYIGLKDLEHFNIFYEGIALGFAITAFVLAGIEYQKKMDQEDE
jgi:hypothetical protein